MKVLVVGSGGREHCLVWKIAQSCRVKKIWCARGNGGTGLLAENIDISPTDIESLKKFALKEKIDLTVVGPEAPLVEGIGDIFEKEGLKIFAPSQELAMLEGSKVFAKEKMKEFGVPTAEFEVFNDPYLAEEYVKNKKMPIVIKAEGLAGGKGVFVVNSPEEAREAIRVIMVEKKFGKSGERIIIEEYLEGEEASILVFTDGETVLPLVSAQDHKQVFEGDKGPNTGGMGAYAPAPIVTFPVWEKINKRIFIPLIKGLKREGKVYKGMLYAGLMIKDNNPYVLEFNVRFGDPETQVILPKLKNDLVEVMLTTVENRLSQVSLQWDERFCLCVVLASRGYPGKYERGKEIRGLEKIEEMKDVLFFHAGTKVYKEGSSSKVKYFTDGGRVLNVVGLAPTIQEAHQKVYQAIENIYFENIYYRKDIGRKALKS
ncbi:MAG: phosphoribosylamine--glycine ligase [Candidatus Omnitrophica bacterium 4484_70.2]|nr:MAG: phosphoribosylamine--glycine ligase [Candidatus Omnitrophica bacterium 4484_70.2]